MPLHPISLDFFYREGRNVHESIVVASKRARQVNEDIKIEFNQRVELITTKTETEAEENDINPDQLKISIEFEQRAKPTDTALEDLTSGRIEWRYLEREEPAPAVEEDSDSDEDEEEEE